MPQQLDTATIEPVPCKKCGSSAFIHLVEKRMGWNYHVDCTNPKCESDHKHNYPTKDGAITAWNAEQQ